MELTSKKTLKDKQRKLIDQLFVFVKAQLSAFVGGITDYFIMVFLTEAFHLHYTISIACSGMVGAVINFSLNKQWTFRNKDIPYTSSKYRQLFKFGVVVLNSIFLKSSGTYLVTTFLKLDYKVSRIFVDLIVSIGFNYTLQRFWVFKKQKVEILENSN